LNKKDKIDKFKNQGLKFLKIEVKEIPECKPPNDKIIQYYFENSLEES